MKDLRLFGTEQYPLRPSSLQKLVTCPWRAVIMFFELEQDEVGEAADTGSAMHKAAAEWHKSGARDIRKAVNAMRDSLADFPKANLDDSEKLFRYYAADPRNIKAETPYVEKEIRFTLPPTSYDETQEEIVVTGTLDQVRIINGRAFVYDIKTSKRAGRTLLNESALQIAAYCHGASYTLFNGNPVFPGCLILPRTYDKAGVNAANSPPGVFWEFTWSWRHIPTMLLAVRSVVANIRAGHIWHNPNDMCNYCPAVSPASCLPRLHDLGIITH